MYEDFGKWLRAARKRRRITQKELGRLTGYSDGYISILENAAPHSESGGSVRPSEDFIEKVSSALRVKEEDGRLLAGYHADPVPITLREIPVLVVWRRACVTDDAREKAANIRGSAHNGESHAGRIKTCPDT